MLRNWFASDSSSLWKHQKSPVQSFIHKRGDTLYGQPGLLPTCWRAECLIAHSEIFPWIILLFAYKSNRVLHNEVCLAQGISCKEQKRQPEIFLSKAMHVGWAELRESYQSPAWMKMLQIQFARELHLPLLFFQMKRKEVRSLSPFRPVLIFSFLTILPVLIKEWISMG